MFTKQLVDCMEHDEKRQYLKGLPLSLIASMEIDQDAFYWMGYIRTNSN